MTSILMVCLGNICRSPLAHGLLESKLSQENFYVDSAGTANYHVGDAPDARSIKVAKQHGIDISQQLGRQFQISDFDSFDHIYVMDDSNYENLIKLARNEEDRVKVKSILSIDHSITANAVPDPYYGDFSDFEHAYALLDNVCNILAKQLQKK